MTTKIINNRNDKVLTASDVKSQPLGTTILSRNSKYLYIVIGMGIVRLDTGYTLAWGNLESSSMFDVVDLEITVK